MLEIKNFKEYTLINFRDCARLTSLSQVCNDKTFMDILAGLECANVVLNMGNVKFVDSHCLGAMVLFVKKMSEKNGRVAFCHLHNQVLSSVKTMRLDVVFNIFDNETEAIKFFEV